MKSTDFLEILALEVKHLCLVKKVDVIPIVVGALGAVSQRVENFIQRIGFNIRVEHLQTATPLGTTQILRIDSVNLIHRL